MRVYDGFQAIEKDLLEHLKSGATPGPYVISGLIRRIEWWLSRRRRNGCWIYSWTFSSGPVVAQVYPRRQPSVLCDETFLPMMILRFIHQAVAPVQNAKLLHPYNKLTHLKTTPSAKDFHAKSGQHAYRCEPQGTS